MTVKEAVQLLSDRRDQLASAKAEAALWRRQVNTAEKLLTQAESCLTDAMARESEANRTTWPSQRWLDGHRRAATT